MGLRTFLLIALVVVAGCEKKLVGEPYRVPEDQLSAPDSTQPNSQPSPNSEVVQPTTKSSGAPQAPQAGSPSSSVVEPGSRSTSSGPGRIAGAPSNAPRVQRPQMPPADETAQGAYEADGTKLEVEGTCRITEDELQCWKADGTSNGDLEAKIRESLQDESYGREAQLSFRVGKKNRYVVFKTTRTGGGNTSTHVSQMGDDMMGSSGTNLMIRQDRNPQGGRADYNTSYQVRFVSTEKSATETSARLSVTKTLQEMPKIETNPGASISVAGYTVTIETIEKAANINTMYGTQVPGWRIKVKLSKAPDQHSNVSLNADHGMMVGPGGKLVTQQEFMDAMRPSGSGQFDPSVQMRYSPVSLNPEYRSGPTQTDRTSLTYVCNADPKLLKTFRVVVFHTKTVELKGIRLDPR